MKSSMLLAIGSALAWAALTPIMCQAQSEVSPDHFEMTNVEPFVQPLNAATANGGSVQKQIGGEGEGNDDQRRASIFHSASFSGSKRAATVFAPSGSRGPTAAWRSRRTAVRNTVTWKVSYDVRRNR
jgi:hypothetical protein